MEYPGESELIRMAECADNTFILRCAIRKTAVIQYSTIRKAVIASFKNTIYITRYLVKRFRDNGIHNIPEIIIEASNTGKIELVRYLMRVKLFDGNVRFDDNERVMLKSVCTDEISKYLQQKLGFTWLRFPSLLLRNNPPIPAVIANRNNIRRVNSDTDNVVVDNVPKDTKKRKYTPPNYEPVNMKNFRVRMIERLTEKDECPICFSILKGMQSDDLHFCAECANCCCVSCHEKSTNQKSECPFCRAKH